MAILRCRKYISNDIQTVFKSASAQSVTNLLVMLAVIFRKLTAMVAIPWSQRVNPKDQDAAGV